MIRVQVSGVARVQAGLARTAHDLDRPTPALDDAGNAVARTAARLAAKRTGRMARATAARTVGPLAEITNRVRYAPYQESGTEHMQAHPFMRPALTMTPVATYFEDYADVVLRRNL